MRTRLVVAGIGAAFVTWLASDPARSQSSGPSAPHETGVPVGKISLYAREIGRGQLIIVLHGGPDFDHCYLLPDLDRLSDAFRLVYYGCASDARSNAW